MKRRTFIQSFAAGAVTLVGFKPQTDIGAETAGALETAFRQPPAGAHAKTWWHWMNGNVTAEGITLDIEAMKRAGIRGFQIFQVGTGIPKGPVDYSSTEHARLLQHAAKEADRLGMEFDIMNCPGWSSSGGPWITPEYSMKQFTWSEMSIRGGRQIVAAVPLPYTKLGYYRDAFVLAFPALEGESHPWQQTLRGASTTTGAIDPSVLLGGVPPRDIEIRPPAPAQPAFLQLEFSEPFEARSLITAALWRALGGASATKLPIGWKLLAMAFSSRRFATLIGAAAGGNRWSFPARQIFPRCRRSSTASFPCMS